MKLEVRLRDVFPRAIGLVFLFQDTRRKMRPQQEGQLRMYDSVARARAAVSQQISQNARIDRRSSNEHKAAA